MELEAALQVIDQVCANFQGNRAQHIQIQEALEVVVTAARGPDFVAEVPSQNGNATAELVTE